MVALGKHSARRVRFQKSIFPENVAFDGKKFGTAKMSLVYELNQTCDADSSKLVNIEYLKWNTLENALLEWEAVSSLLGLPELKAA